MKSTLQMTLAGLLIAGCAAGTPEILVDARESYQTASEGPAQQRAKTELYEAQKALTRAEKAFEAEGDEPITRDLAYVADRKARVAQAVGERKLAQVQLEGYEAEYQELSDRLRKEAREQLTQTREQLKETEAEAQKERAGRIAAEAQLAEALDQLREFAKIVENQRGTVITLSAGVLFGYDKYELLPPAYDKLNKVAEMLKKDPDRTIQIVGHTDSHGSDSYNMDLSQKRAEAVRTYLVQQGVDAQRVTAKGMGETQPITSNDNPEGRATNRRVEIVLDPKPE